MRNVTLSFKRPEADLSALELLAREFPNADAAIAEIARLAAVQTLPQGAIHVISDIHGEDKKLRHVINNASGTLRPLVEEMFGDTMEPAELQEFLKLTFYPAEVTERLEKTLQDPDQLRSYAQRTLRPQLELLRYLMSNFSLRLATQVFPAEYSELLMEMLHAPSTDRGPEFIGAMVDELLSRGRAMHLIHLLGRLIRNLAIDELIIGGDCWDRGPRGDRVVDYLSLQPNVSFIWGNHDLLWLGAALGHEALICTVLRVSCATGDSVSWTKVTGCRSRRSSISRAPFTPMTPPSSSCPRARACVLKRLWLGCRRPPRSCSSSWKAK